MSAVTVVTVVTADGAMTPQFVSAAGRHLLLTSRIVLLLVWSSSPHLATGSHTHIYTALRGPFMGRHMLYALQ